MAAAAVVDPSSVPTGLGAREQIDLGSSTLNLQKIENPQASIHQCAQRYGPQTIRSIFEKLQLREKDAIFEDINLADNTIGDEGAQYLAQGLKGNKSLKCLQLPRAGMGAEGFHSIGTMIAECPALEILVMSSNICDAAGMDGDFKKGLTSNKSLKSLFLAACRIGNSGLKHLCDGPLAKHGSLEHICLTYNRLEGAVAAQSLNKALASNRTLRFLDLSGNSLGPDGAQEIVKGLKDNKGNLKKISLAQNGLRLKGAQVLVDFFVSKEGSHIDFLDLRHNAVGYRGVAELRKKLGKPLDGEDNDGWLMLFDNRERQLFLDAC